jgi:phytoene synthase
MKKDKRESRLDLFTRVSMGASAGLTRQYSTSFSKAIHALGSDIRDAVYGIYGFVRLVDEVVDSFQGYDQEALFYRLRKETWMAIEEQISTNLVLHAFQKAYHQYGLDSLHVEQFFLSMEKDLKVQEYDRGEYDRYIQGSAEAVGLMCLKVFVRGDQAEYDALSPAAIRLGAAFQKINFLRDVQEDYVELGRSYFPGVNIAELDTATKIQIEDEIEADMRCAYEGIVRLPRDTRFGVYLAYRYYWQLLKRIRRVSSSQILHERIRVPDVQKAALLVLSYTRHQLNFV